MKTKIKVSFKSKNQLSWLMVIKEYYWGNGEMAWADVIFQIWPTKRSVISRILKGDKGNEKV
jgi:hypothetical protein